MFVLRVLLFPFALLFDLITRIRNHLYSIGWKPSTTFEVPVIAIGNLSMGGTGKTPMVEYIIRLLKPEHDITVLSRGYGRKTRGFRLAHVDDTPQTIGDEPHQLFRKFGDHVTVAVGEDRVLAISEILQHRPSTSVIILDDAFQHRRIRPRHTILLSDRQRPFYNDFLFPAGMLRESRLGASRADAIVVTKCRANMSVSEMTTISNEIKPYSQADIFFSTIRYGDPAPALTGTGSFQRKVILVTGIGNAEPLREHVAQRFELVHHYEFSDHHNYSRSDIEKITGKGGANSVLTTEKDKAKLADLWPAGGPALWYLPIEIAFVENGRDFDATIVGAAKPAPGDKNG